MVQETFPETGFTGRPPLESLPLADSANQALHQFRQLTGSQDDATTGAGLLYERAFMHKLTHGAAPTGGSCRLLVCNDAVLAVNLPRAQDWEQLPAWFGPWRGNVILEPGDWPALADHCRDFNASELLPQAHMLGLAVATADQLPAAPAEPVQSLCFRREPETAKQQHRDRPLVVDLSSLWAGPLCSFLLQQAGCRVIKVEGLNRLDGARSGLADFYRLLNQGKESVVLDFKSEPDINRLKQLIGRADIVIEASRPRALRNIGIHAEQLVQSQPGLVWLSITGYGRKEGNENRIGFGDDAAVAAGLSRIMYEATGSYQIVGDAIADPLTGIHAALFAWQSYLAGGNELVSISLRDTVSYCLHQELNLNREQVLESCRKWQRESDSPGQFFPNGARIPGLDSAEPGQHNESVFKELDSASLPEK